MAKRNNWLSKKHKIVLIILVLTGLLLFMISYRATQQISLLSKYDYLLIDFVSSHRTIKLNSLFGLFTKLGEPLLLIIVVSLISINWVRRKNDAWRPLLILLSMGLTALISSIIKNIVRNPRPDKSYMVPPIETGFSFPSNHTILILVFMLIAGYLLYSRYKKKDKKIWLYNWVTITSICTLSMAASRLYLGYHWLSDTIASIGLGLIIFSLVVLVDRFVVRKP